MTRPDLAFDMVRPGIAVYGQTPIPARGDMGLRPAMTLKCPVALVRSVKCRRRRVLRPHLDRRPRHHAGAAADRLRRRRVPHPERSHRRADQRPAAAQRRPHLHGPVRRRPRARAQSTSPRATTRSCSGRARTASPPLRTGPNCWAPSTTRSSPARVAGSPGRTAVRSGRAKVVERPGGWTATRPQVRRALAGRGSRADRGRHRRGRLRRTIHAQARHHRRPLRGRGFRATRRRPQRRGHHRRTGCRWRSARSAPRTRR